MSGIKLYEEAQQLAAMENPDLQKVHDLLQQSASTGYHEAYYTLGTWNLNGIFVKKNLKKAVELFALAADGGNALAHYDLGVCYESGEGVKRDLNAAVFHYSEAVLLGDKQSIYELGRMLYYYHKKLDIQSMGLVFTDFFERNYAPPE